MQKQTLRLFAKQLHPYQRYSTAPSSAAIKALLNPGRRKDLAQIVKLDMVAKEDLDSIKYIWKMHHLFTLDMVSAVVPSLQYQVIAKRARSCPFFIVPVYKQIGYMNVVIQFQPVSALNNDFSVLMTTKREFDKLKENAFPHVIVDHFTDLEASKGIVLARGKVQDNVLLKELDKAEAQEILDNLYQFYSKDSLFFPFVEAFNKRPHEFRYEQFLEQYRALNPKQQTKQIVLDQTAQDLIQEQKSRVKEHSDYDKWFHSNKKI